MIWKAETKFDFSVESKLKLLNLARELGSVSKACRMMRVGRSTFYVIKKAYDTQGEAGLIEQPRQAPTMPNATSREQESQILLMTARHPELSYVGLARIFETSSIRIGHIRAVWRRHSLNYKAQRLAWAQRQFGGLQSLQNQNL